MRANIESALRNSAAVAACGATVYGWDSQRGNPAEDPKITLETGLRVDPAGIDFDPYAYNAATRFTQRLQIAAWLPVNKGLQAAQMEALCLALCRALTPLTRDQMVTPVSGVERVTLKGGDLSLAASKALRPDESPKLADAAWSHVAEIEIVHEVPVSELVE